ncbi:MAG: dienelactone hydrolase family protein [Comamonadaceae bacterium]|nr:MAG: dienelactone hydrolase family protein [Comamonadaceae bacterium]
MKGQWIDVPAADGGRSRGYLSLPAQGSGPGLVLCQEIFGVTEGIRELADLYAEEGYVVLAPDLFWRLQPGLELGEADVQLAMGYAQRFDAALGVQDIAACAAALRDHPACKGRIGVLGHCLGGRMAVLAAASGAVDCAISYYGVGIDAALAQVGTPKVPMVLHFAGQDRLVQPAAVEKIRAHFADRHDVEVYVYPGVDHAFASPGRHSFDPQAAGMAHTRSLALLRRVLGPHYDLNALWEAHRACEFDARDADATIATMVDVPYVNHIPTMTGGYGRELLRRFYRDHFIPKSPKDTRAIPISRTLGVDRVVNEVLFCFTHDSEIDWMLPGVAPTGKYVEVGLVGIISFRGDKLMNEHIYWDQASVLVQIGLLDPKGLPVVGHESARKLMDPSRPSNTLIAGWSEARHD